jgi:hypothetical protein
MVAGSSLLAPPKRIEFVFIMFSFLIVNYFQRYFEVQIAAMDNRLPVMDILPRENMAVLRKCYICGFRRLVISLNLLRQAK